MSDEADILLSREQVREVDRRAIEEYGIPGIVLMENAARGAAEIIRREAPAANRVAILCGRGNNGGDGLAIARHLTNAGAAVSVLLACDPAQLAGDARTNFGIVSRMGIECHRIDTPAALKAHGGKLRNVDVIVDALLGTGFSGEVRPPIDAIIDAINAAACALVVAVDLPSGLDCDTGRPASAVVRADVTVTFVAKKKGFASPAAAEYLGRVCVVDIGAPAALVRSLAGSG